MACEGRICSDETEQLKLKIRYNVWEHICRASDDWSFPREKQKSYIAACIFLGVWPESVEDYINNIEEPTDSFTFDPGVKTEQDPSVVAKIYGKGEDSDDVEDTVLDESGTADTVQEDSPSEVTPEVVSNDTADPPHPVGDTPELPTSEPDIDPAVSPRPDTDQPQGATSDETV